MTEASVSFAGNFTDHPEVRQSEGGITRATFRVADFARHDSKPRQVSRYLAAREKPRCGRLPKKRRHQRRGRHPGRSVLCRRSLENEEEREAVTSSRPTRRHARRSR
jgi:hypothetical protein